MKKNTIAFLLILALGSLSWSAAQGAKTELFDLKKSRQELEIMKGILNATLGFAANEIRGGDKSADVFQGGLFHNFGGGSDISAFYLYGQGATFIIPISGFRFATTRSRALLGWTTRPKTATVYDRDMEKSLQQLGQEMDALQYELAANNEDMARAARDAAEAAQELAREASEYSVLVAGGVTGGVPGGVSGGVVGGVPGGVAGGVGTGVGVGSGKGGSTPLAQASPAPKPAKQQMDREEMRKKLEDAQAKIRKTREEVEARRKKLIESLTQASGYLVEALANHGDSLTHVRPNEYINIIITSDNEYLVFAQNTETRSQREVISVQKSHITDYKAGRITLDAFKQKVLQYNN